MTHGETRSARPVHGRAPQRSLFAHRAHLFWTLRASSHVNLVLLGGLGGRWRRAVLLSAALVGDLAHRRWLDRDPRPHAAVRALLDTAESAVWTALAGPSPDATYWTQQAHVVPPAMEWGYRTGAGDRAVPVVDPPRPFPPRGPALARAAAELAATTIAPLGVHLAIRTRRRWGWQPFELHTVAFTAVGPFWMGRYRERIQGQARAEWWERAEVEVARDLERARASSAVRASPGHDFKKNLTTLGWNGSEACMVAAHQQADRPRRHASRADGTTLFGAALGIPVEPPDRRGVWISDEQRRVLDRFVDEVDAELEMAPPRPRIDVLEVDGPTVRLRYRGRHIDLVNPPPRPETALDPVVPTLAVGIIWKLISSTSVGHRWHRGHLAASIGLDVLNAIVYDRARRAQAPHRFRVVVGSAIVSAAVAGIGIARSRVPTRDGNGRDLFVGSYAAYPVLGLVGACWDQLDRRTRAVALISAVTQWWVVANRGRQRQPTRVLAEAIALWQAVVAPQGLTSRVAAEASYLEDLLQADFQRRVRQARVQAADDELAAFRTQLELVESELDRLRDAIDPDLAEQVARQCGELRAWLDDPASRQEMLS